MSTEIQKYDPETERLRLLSEYNANEHLIQWTAFDKRANKSTVVTYLPAAWRLYELRLRFPASKFDIDILHMDLEKNFCIVRAKLYTGETYETSQIRAVAHKQGLLTELDKVETKAKARAARDVGIGTEHALDMDEMPDNEVRGTIVTEVPATPRIPQKPVLDDSLKSRLNGLFERAKPLGILEEPSAKGFLRFASEALGTAITHPNQLDAVKLDAVEAEIARKASEAVQLEAAS